jgi:hypothetical protein
VFAKIKVAYVNTKKMYKRTLLLPNPCPPPPMTYEYKEEREVANEQFWLDVADEEGVCKQFSSKNQDPDPGF